MSPIHLGHSQASASQGISRKWSRLNVQDEESDDNPIAFDNLPSCQPCDVLTPEIVDIEVRKNIPPTGQPLLSRPRPVIYPLMRSNEPEQSILYPAFVRMVDSLVAAGTLAGHKKVEM
ncbi:hypothetical protein J3R83DRAFT_8329 [Lanmaoa asiatica]|nr:hypothetical protein J3R83DRAFT_8329 [Lanmaoa asiatica]